MKSFQLNSKWFWICHRTIFCWDATLWTNLTAVADWQNLLCFVVKLHWTSTTPDPKGGIHKWPHRLSEGSHSTSTTWLARIYFKVNSVQKTCAQCFAVHILKFEILQTTWKGIQMLDLLMKNWKLRVWCSLFNFFM